MMLILILFLASVAGCKKHDAGEINTWHYLIVDDIFAYSWTSKIVVNYKSDYDTKEDLVVEPIEYCEWVSDFDVQYDKIYIALDSNKTSVNRHCLFIAYSEKTGQQDTFRIEQSKAYESIGSSSGGPSDTAIRCAAKTKNGTRCKRRAAKGSIYCWQHGG